MLTRFSSAGEATKTGINNTINEKADQNNKPVPRPGRYGSNVKVVHKTVTDEKNKPGIKPGPILVNEADVLEEVIIEDGQENTNTTKVRKKVLEKAEK